MAHATLRHQQHRPGRRRSDRATPAVRVLGAGLLVAVGGIHVDLYLTSYGHIPTIGPLFLAQAVAAIVLGLLAAASRHPLPSAAGALLALATLGGYVLSLWISLFGFQEVRTTAGIVAAVLDLGASAGLGLAASRAAGLGWGRSGVLVAVPPFAGALAVSFALAYASVPAAGSSGGDLVTAVQLRRFGRVLASGKHISLYLLSTETNGRIVCTGACLSIWPPLVLGAGEKPPTAVAGLAGHLGAVDRPGGVRQLTYNGYPLYLYAGDSRPGQATGQAITSFGGTWYLLRASARTPAETTVR